MGALRSIFSLTKKIETYQGIEDLPIYNWWKINETNELSWLLLNQELSYYADDKLLKPLWEKIFDEFIDTFGMPEKMRSILELKRDIQVLEWDIILTGDKSLQTFIDIKNFELQELLKEEKAQTNGQAKIYIEKYMGFRLDEKTLSVKDYYGYVNALKADIAQRNGQIVNEYGRE